ncbi:MULTISPECIES: ABC transporter permease [Ensifer]|uniref:ABC transporter permease n=1 Tax=Ensifer TaxID=106591 RepID=UPI00046D6313|nr:MULTISPECIES: ABC transporter permease [Ensifer]MDP9629342.1 erythritol transport system permease protein [Ensifer adhaerens]KQU90685.1 sugar ABC transporter permease [Ensifer sp. Root31]KQW67435.1 sugar ABC transporter permease [Ensifer sp. Root127]KQY63037.1 sugar ABC transporter permease [Ensifer sp. Root142]MBD9489239.1 ABC transporter permease [Ensifer sp. ENS11]
MTTATQTAAAGNSLSTGAALLTLMKLRTFIALFAVIIFFSIFAPNFLSTANMILMSKHATQNAFLAIGMTFVIITGGIDLSVGSIVGLCGMIAGGLIMYGVALPLGYTVYFNIVEVAIIVMAVGILIGAVNGLLITRLNVAPFIATLGTLYVARGMALLYSDGQTLPNLNGREDLGNQGFSYLGSGSILGLPVSVWILIVVALGAAYFARFVPLGRHIFAVGGNERASRMSGIRVNRVKMFVYMFSGFCAAIVGLVISSELMASHPATGTNLELNAIAAAVLGGTSMSGGRGTIGGTIIGAFVIGILSDGLVMMGVSSFWQMVIKGLVIIVAVVVDQAQRRLQQRVALMQMAKAG